MINYVVCDLFASPARTLVNTVNTVGVMGKGIAKSFKTIYPEMFSRYQELCEKGQFDIGQLWLYRTPNKWVLNFPTKKHWRSPSQPQYIETGLQTFASTYHLYGITSISFPLLGCGNGELVWETQVQPLMEKYLSKLPIDVYIHLLNRNDPFTPEHRNIREVKKWLRGEPESLAFREVWADLIAAIATNPHSTNIETLRSFRAQITNDGEYITVDLPEGTLSIPEEAFLDLWQQLRSNGFLAGDHLPCGLHTYAAWIVPLMAKLPYIQKVEMAEHSKQANVFGVGLRITPAVVKPNIPELLMSGIGAVEPE